MSVEGLSVDSGSLGDFLYGYFVYRLRRKYAEKCIADSLFDLMTLTSCSFMIAPLVYYVCLSACLYEVRGPGIAACLYT